MPIATAIMAGAAIAGVGISAYGMVTQHSALEEQKRAQQIAVGQQTEAIAGMNAAQKDEIQNQQLVEGERKKQMDLEFRRQQIQVVRNWQGARAMSLALATNQGVGGTSQSSALAGAFGNEAGEAGRQLTAGKQNYQIGNDTFALNKKISDARIQLADYQSAYNIASANFTAAGARGAAGAAEGAGMMSLGGAMVSAAGTFGNVAGSSAGAIKNGFGNAFSFGTGPGAWGSNNRFT